MGYFCGCCPDRCPTILDPDMGYICCEICGKVLDRVIGTGKPTNIKDKSGQSCLSGTIPTTFGSGYSVSHESKSTEEGRDEIRYIHHCLDMAGKYLDEVHNFYQGLASKVNLDAVGDLYNENRSVIQNLRKIEAEQEEENFDEFAEFEENAENGLEEFDFMDEFVFY